MFIYLNVICISQRYYLFLDFFILEYLNILTTHILQMAGNTTFFCILLKIYLQLYFGHVHTFIFELKLRKCTYTKFSYITLNIKEVKTLLFKINKIHIITAEAEEDV